MWFKCSSYAEINIPSNASIYISGCYIMVVLLQNKAHVLHVLEKRNISILGQSKSNPEITECLISV